MPAKKKTTKKKAPTRKRSPRKGGAVGTKATVSRKTVRLNLVIDEKLRDEIKVYAKEKHTTVTQIIIDHFVDLLESEREIGVKSI